MTSQPPPKPNDRTAIVDLMIADLEKRKALGIERYGVPLQPFNQRDAGRDLWEEMIDAAVYARQLWEERKEQERALYRARHTVWRFIDDGDVDVSLSWDRALIRDCGLVVGEDGLVAEPTFPDWAKEE